MTMGRYRLKSRGWRITRMGLLMMVEIMETRVGVVSTLTKIIIIRAPQTDGLTTTIITTIIIEGDLTSTEGGVTTTTTIITTGVDSILTEGEAITTTMEEVDSTSIETITTITGLGEGLTSIEGGATTGMEEVDSTSIGMEAIITTTTIDLEVALILTGMEVGTIDLEEGSTSIGITIIQEEVALILIGMEVETIDLVGASTSIGMGVEITEVEEGSTLTGMEVGTTAGGLAWEIDQEGSTSETRRNLTLFC